MKNKIAKEGEEVMKKFLLCIIFIIFLSLFSLKSNAASLSWYCKRNDCHTQPQLGSDLKIAENYDVYWCDKNNNDYDSKEKVIYLTFDAGYENGNIEKIIEVLKKEDVKATFFILDNMILKNEALVGKMIEDGHCVANHTLKHKDMTKLNSIDEFKRELEALENLYEATFGKSMPKLYRPPEGKLNEENLKWAKELGYKTVMWSFAYADWDNEKQPSREYAITKILDNLHNGEIMLLHPTSRTNAEIMSDLIRALKSRGYKFCTVQDLCEK